MTFETVDILNYGPFAFMAKLRLEPDVTVLTGPNDTGKSSLLRLLAHVCAAKNDYRVPVDEFNFDNFDDRQLGKDPATVKVRVTFSLAAPYPDGIPDWATRPALPANLLRSMAVEFEFDKDKTTSRVQEARSETGTVLTISFSYQSPFRVISLPPKEPIRDHFYFTSPNASERHLLRLAFGADSPHEDLLRLSPTQFTRRLTTAEAKLNERVRDILPPSLGLRWVLRESGVCSGLSIILTDSNGGTTPLGARGTGVQKVMAAFAHLMGHDYGQGRTLILFDEPETSLHADSQHLLREVLESLGAKPNVQVVYATHSPSMINVMRPHSVRLLRRESREGKATTVIDNQPFKDNYLPVRTSLGLTPADSLLYAPVTVVVEGDTEVVALQMLLLKLAEANTPGFERTKYLLSQSHFLDGMGDRYPFICQMAKSQGAKPVIFLDGDKKRHLAKHKLDQTHPDVPIVTLADDEEFEQLVPEDVYFRALADVLDHQAEQLTAENYRLWDSTANLPPRMAFTKRVGRWLDTLGLPEPGKAQVMRRAVELADVGQVSIGPLMELIRQIERLLSA